MTVGRLAQQPKPHTLCRLDSPSYRAYQSLVITVVRQARLHSSGGERVNFDCFHEVSKLAASNKASGEMGEFYVNTYGLGVFSVACHKAPAKRVRCPFSLVSMLLRSWSKQALVQDGRNARHLLMLPNVAHSDCCLHTWVPILRCSGSRTLKPLANRSRLNSRIR